MTGNRASTAGRARREGRSGAARQGKGDFPRALGRGFNTAAWWCLALVLLLLMPSVATGAPAAERLAVLRRGIAITGWFRHPASRDPAVLRGWLSDMAMADLKRAGFTFVRLAFDPAVLDGEESRLVFLEQVARLRRQGLGVVVSPHPVGWSIDTNPADRSRFVAFWRGFAPLLRDTPPGMVFPEVLNEPVFAGKPAAWWALQRELHGILRAALPAHTLVLTGHDWSSVEGLLALPPLEDGNVLYGFHYYDPAELTALAAYRSGLDRAAFARLPFPVGDPAACRARAASGDAATGGLVGFYCDQGWDAARVRARFQQAATWARAQGAALLLGEFGASAALNPVARLAWMRLVADTSAAQGIGWTLWGYDDVMGLNVPRPPQSRPVLDRSVLEALRLTVP